ncbi:hypothetical protein EDD63_1882, partial [Breznakia blatticola]
TYVIGALRDPGVSVERLLPTNPSLPRECFVQVKRKKD